LDLRSAAGFPYPSNAMRAPTTNNAIVKQTIARAIVAKPAR
jgi:hypothetical protein